MVEHGIKDSSRGITIVRTEEMTEIFIIKEAGRDGLSTDQKALLNGIRQETTEEVWDYLRTMKPTDRRISMVAMWLQGGKGISFTSY